MPQKQSRIIIFLIIPLAIAGFWFLRLNKSYPNPPLKIGDARIEIEIADSPMERQQGLSGRELLADNTGLFFVFDKDDFYHIWMKDMKFSIDIIWINDQGTVVTVKNNISPSTYPQTFTSDKPARFVLETPSGWAMRNGIKPGDGTNAPRLVK